MKLQLLIAAAAVSLVATAATAQTTTIPAPDRPVVPNANVGDRLILTDAQAKNWVDKRVYSSDGRDIGEVVSFTRDAAGNVTDMHADIGGFLGIGETRVRVMPGQFSLSGDRVMLNLTAEQAKALPKVAQ